MTLAHARANRAIALVCIAYFLYASGDAALKYIGTALPVGTIMTCAGAVMVMLSLIALGLRRQIPTLWTTPKWRLHLLRMATVGALACLATNALRTVPLPDFYGIIFMSPFLVGIFAHFFLHEEIGRHRIIATIIGFIGVIILAGPHFAEFHLGYVLVTIQLFIVAVHVMIVRKIGAGDPWPLLTFFPGLGIFLVGLAQFAIHPVLPDLSWLPMLSLYAVAIWAGQIAFSLAFATTPLTAILAPYLYTQMVWALLFSMVIFHQPPTTATWIGGSIIVLSGLGNILYERHLRRRHIMSVRVTKPT
jgi:S-adenosylmethionine uptake transporter